MRSRCITNSVYYEKGSVEGSVETDGGVRARNVIVYCCRNAYYRYSAGLIKFACRSKRAVSSDYDKPLDFVGFQGLRGF